jgi:hypothetical protein
MGVLFFLLKTFFKGKIDFYRYRRRVRMKKFSMLLLITSFSFIASVAMAFDFYGASVTDKDIPSSFMKYGLYGFHTIITDVSNDSPAYKTGLKRGDIILSINNKDITKSMELGNITTDVIKIVIFNGIERQAMTINRLAIEAEKSKLIDKEKVTTSVKHINHTVEQSDNSPALKFDDEALDKKYGKTSPEQLARQKQIADSLTIKDENEKQRKLDELEAEKKRIEAEKLAKTECEGGIPGECGPGRKCVYKELSYFGKKEIIEGSGVCKTEAEANRLVDLSNQAIRDRNINNKLDDIQDTADRIKSNTDSIDRQLKFGF